MELTGDIVIAGRSIPYRYHVHARARRVRLSVTRTGLVVSGPRRFDIARLLPLLREKADWIIRHVERRDGLSEAIWPVPRAGDFQRFRNQAATLVQVAIKRFNGVYQVSPRSVSIRNQSTRWGSCSKSGRLNFNYRLVHLPPALVEYLVVHELCHLKEMNHSHRFWSLVAKTIPDYQSRRKELRRYLLR